MILLTGATGVVGAAAAASLRAWGVAFRAAVRPRFDWERTETYGPELRGATRVLLLTPVHERQVEMGRAFVEEARRAGVEHVVKVSVAGVERDAEFARRHREVEDAMRASGLGWTMVRPTFFVQNFVTYYGADPTGGADVHLAHGEGEVAWVDARDVGEVVAAALARPGHAGQAYELTGPEPLSSAAVLSILGLALGVRYRYVAVTPEAARQALERMGTPPWLVRGAAELDALVREGRASEVRDGVARALGRPPRSVRQWARDFASARR